MKKVANILFLVGGIYSFILVASLVIIGIVFLVFSSAGLTATIIIGIQNGSIKSSFTGTPEEIAALVQLTFLITGIILLFIASFGIVNGILSLKARNTDNKNLYIANIVFGILSDTPINVVGAIFALIKGNTLEDYPNSQVI